MAGIGAIALSVQSPWSDELGTWRLARADALSAWAHQLLTWRDSDSRLPLYHAWIKLFTSVVPRQEWWLSLQSPLVGIDGLCLLARSRRITGRPAGAFGWTGLCLSSADWYYSYELRPYAMLSATTTVAGIGLVSIWMESDDAATASLGRHFLRGGLALLAVCSPIGVIWSAAFAPAALSLSRGRGRACGFKAQRGVASLTYLVLLVPVFVQYVMSFVVRSHVRTPFVFAGCWFTER